MRAFNLKIRNTQISGFFFFFLLSLFWALMVRTRKTNIYNLEDVFFFFFLLLLQHPGAADWLVRVFTLCARVLKEDKRLTVNFCF